jgi:hypothetical protein
MTIPDHPTDQDIESYVRQNRDAIVRVLRQSSDNFARACAWTLLDRGLPELTELRREFDRVQQEGTA